MRTKWQLKAKETDMTAFHQIKQITNRSEATLFQDAIGLAALTVMLVVGLHLPVLV